MVMLLDDGKYLTDDIFKIVSASNFPMTTTEVREQLQELFRIMTDHRNPLASINAILNRLAESGRVEETVKDGRKAWQRASYRLAGVNRSLSDAPIVERHEIDKNKQ